MLTVTQFAKVLAARKRRANPFSRAYIHLLIAQKRIVPTPSKIGESANAPYLIDDKAIILPLKSA